MNRSRTRAGTGTLVTGVLLLVTGLVTVPALGEASTPLSVQTCNTRCQTVQTDCVLRCDGEIPCIQECQKVADACVDRCQTPLPKTDP
jgi:hypothetical protein